MIDPQVSRGVIQSHQTGGASGVMVSPPRRGDTRDTDTTRDHRTEPRPPTPGPLTGSSWRHFGSWPSTHDYDLWLDADESTYDAIEGLFADLDPHGFETRTVLTVALPVPDLTADIASAVGLPLDLFLSPRPGGFSAAAWISPPYTDAHIAWRPTLCRWFFG